MVDTVCDRQRFVAEGVTPPDSKDSPQRRADKYAVLLAGPWPTRVTQFFRRYREPLAEVVRKFESRHDLARDAGPWLLSVAEELGRELCTVAVRNAGIWHAQWTARGANPDEEWVALLIGAKGRALKTFYERRTRSVPHRTMAGGGQRGAWVEQFSATGWRKSSNPHRVSVERLHEAIQLLPPVQQRCVRLKFGMFPVRQEWSPQRIGRYLQLKPAEVKSQIDTAVHSLHAALC